MKRFRKVYENQDIPKEGCMIITSTALAGISVPSFMCTSMLACARDRASFLLSLQKRTTAFRFPIFVRSFVFTNFCFGRECTEREFWTMEFRAGFQWIERRSHLSPRPIEISIQRFRNSLMVDWASGRRLPCKS